MLRLLEIELKLPDGERVNRSMGSVLHGALMEQIPGWAADELHGVGLRPYSQSVFFSTERKKAIWRFGFLNDKIYQIITEALPVGKKLFLQNKGYYVFCTSSEIVRVCSCEELADNVFLSEESPWGAEFSFLTTGSFKQNGHYVLLPELQLIWQNLLTRWNTFSDYSKLEQDKLAERLALFCRLLKYNLRSQSFSLEHQKIYGYIGDMRVQFNGNDMSNRILGMLAGYAIFAGIGIKTALGMGAVSVQLLKGENYHGG